MLLLSLAIIIISGIFVSIFLEKFNLPHITGYLVAGILIGPSVFGLISHEAIEGLHLINDVALGFIAFSIGSELFFPKLKKTGKQVMIITVVQAVMAAVLVAIVVVLLKLPLYVGLILGAIATATAPGPIMMVIKECKAKGPVVNTLLPLVAIDDALGVVIFGIALSISKVLAFDAGNLNVLHMLQEPFMEIVKSILIGGGIGLVLGFLMQRRTDKEFYLSITTAGVFLGVYLAHAYHASPILLPMMIGIGFTNVVNKECFERETDMVDHFTPPILLIFFTLAGAELNIFTISTVGVVGAAYILVRAFGKVFGTYVGAKMTHASDNIRKYLGITLIPQAGVAIGLALAAEAALPAPYDTQIKTIVLGATVVYELVGPLLVKIALTKSNEIEYCNLKGANKGTSVKLKAPFKLPKPIAQPFNIPVRMIKRKAAKSS